MVLTALSVMPIPSVMRRRRWLMLGLVGALLALGWVTFEVWFGLTQAR